MKHSSSRLPWALVALLAVLPLLGWWTTGLFDLDEGFYAAVVAEMNRRGEWVTPYFNGKPWFEKPILLYWLAKPTVAWFGEMVGPRLPSVLATLGTYALVAAFCRRRLRAPSSSAEPGLSPEAKTLPADEEGVGGGERTAKLAVLILASSLLVLALGRMMMTDAPLLLALTGAFLTFWESLVGDRRWRLATAALLGVGVLAKGPVACLLFVPVAGWTYWREPELRPRFRGHWLAGVAILLAVVATWYVPAYLANGQTFVQKFLIEQNVGRFTGGDAAHTLGVSSLPAYIPIVLAGMIPWSFWIWAAWPRRAKDLGAETAPLRRYLATWAAVVFLFFSLSGAKLPHYVLPVFPPLAILVAYHLRDRRWAIPTAGILCGVMALVANTVFGLWYGLSGQREAHTLARYVRAQGGDVAVYQMSRRQRDRGTGRPKLQETSLPSLLLYLDRTTVDTDRLDDLVRHPGPLWIITRSDRIQTQDFVAAAKASRHLERIMGAPGGENYVLYRLR
jgi:4-amino-4-deoxy-L-arabinose transferase-like glycosyltransferase